VAPAPDRTEKALAAARDLVTAMGRAQVELAAAAGAVRSVCPTAPVSAVLEGADHALRHLARAVVDAGQRLAHGEAHAVADLDAGSRAFVHLRQEALTAIASGIEGEGGPRSGAEERGQSPLTQRLA
jgi:hypothetical protein